MCGHIRLRPSKVSYEVAPAIVFSQNVRLRTLSKFEQMHWVPNGKKHLVFMLNDVIVMFVCVLALLVNTYLSLMQFSIFTSFCTQVFGKHTATK